MKFVSFIISCILMLTVCSCGTKTNEWKDTHRLLGDGTYQIFNNHVNGKKAYGISNALCNQCIVDVIIKSKEVDDVMYVYGKFTGHDVYVSIDLKNNYARYFVKIEPDDVLGMTEIEKLKDSGTFEMLSTYDDFSDSEKMVFDFFQNR